MVHSRKTRLLQRRNSLSTMFQSLIDGLIIVVLLYLIAVTNRGYFTSVDLLFGLTLLITMAFFYDLLGVYRRHSSASGKVLSLAKSWGLTFMVLLSIIYLLQNQIQISHAYSQVIIFQLFFYGFIGQVIAHLGFRAFHVRTRKASTAKSIVVGTGQLAFYVHERINQNPWIPERVVGLISTPAEPGDNLSEDEQKKVIGKLEDIEQIVRQNDIRSVYFAVSLESSPMIKDVYFKLLDLNVDIHWAPNIFALQLINHSVKEFAGIPILTLSETPLLGTHYLMKEIEDKILAVVAIILAAPILIGTAIAVKINSPGPIIFKQSRTGWDGKEFMIWKFRSMYVNQPDPGQVRQATKDDPRVTKVGKFIRRTSIDELPQIFNVLFGSMSMVGPRPHAVQHNQEYSAMITSYLSRHRIKPGITGLAQVRGFRGETEDLELMRKRVEHDLEYINNWSVAMDIYILVKTVFTLFNDRAY